MIFNRGFFLICVYTYIISTTFTYNMTCWISDCRSNICYIENTVIPIHRYGSSTVLGLKKKIKKSVVGNFFTRMGAVLFSKRRHQESHLFIILCSNFNFSRIICGYLRTIFTSVAKHIFSIPLPTIINKPFMFCDDTTVNQMFFNTIWSCTNCSINE